LLDEDDNEVVNEEDEADKQTKAATTCKFFQFTVNFTLISYFFL